MEDIWKNISERDYDHDLAQQRKENIVLLFAQRFEGCLPRVLKTLKDKGEKVQVQRRNRVFEKGPVRGEDGNDHFGTADDENPGKQGVGKSHDGHDRDGFLYTAGAAGTIVEA